ncbi:uncharacterized protein [Triticum aestivum]|uniref:uncharacterized protein n=1 Tax=Triticum aestivum TaxID=4565 RepID=UPI001D022481|nr:uncharacterized protein LOC123153515 [Triticum aestivum]
MAIVHGGDGTVQCGVVAAQAGDAIGDARGWSFDYYSPGEVRTSKEKYSNIILEVDSVCITVIDELRFPVNPVASQSLAQPSSLSVIILLNHLAQPPPPPTRPSTVATTASLLSVAPPLPQIVTQPQLPILFLAPPLIQFPSKAATANKGSHRTSPPPQSSDPAGPRRRRHQGIPPDLVAAAIKGSRWIAARFLARRQEPQELHAIRHGVPSPPKPPLPHRPCSASLRRASGHAEQRRGPVRRQGYHVKKKDMWELLNGQRLKQGREDSCISLLAILVTIFVITCRVYLQKKTCRV